MPLVDGIANSQAMFSRAEWTAPRNFATLAAPEWLSPEVTAWLREHLPGLIFGFGLVAMSLWMIARQRRVAKGLPVVEGNPRELLYLKNRVRRRTQVAGMFLLMGIMIPVGDCLIPWRQAPRTFGMYWMIVLLLAGWTVLLAVGDMIATRAYLDSELRQLRAKMELERLAHDLRNAPSRRSGDS